MYKLLRNRCARTILGAYLCKSAEFTTASTSTLITFLCRLNAEVKAVEISPSLKQMLYTQSLTSFWFAAAASQLLSVWPSYPSLLKVCGWSTRMLLTQQLEKSLDHAFMPRNRGYLRQLYPLLISTGKQCRGVTQRNIIKDWLSKQIRWVHPFWSGTFLTTWIHFLKSNKGKNCQIF